MVVEGSRPFRAGQRLRELVERRRFEVAGRTGCDCGMIAAQTAAPLVHVSDLGTVVGRTIERALLAQLLPESESRSASGNTSIAFSFSFFLLVRGVARLRQIAQPVALDRLAPGSPWAGPCAPPRACRRCKPSADRARRDCRCADLLVGHVLHQLGSLRILAEKFLADVSAASRLVAW